MADWESVNDFIAGSDHLLVVSHVDPDGDAISSTLATARILREYGKEVTLVNASLIPQRFSFLPGVEKIIQPQQLKGPFKWVVTVDCADRKRVGESIDLYSDSAHILNIDHHVTNDHFGDINVVVTDAAATAEILYDWAENKQISWDPAFAMTIYTGLLTDTGGFRYANTTPQLLRKAAQLLEVGIQADEIADRVLETTTMEQLRLLEAALSTLERSENGQVAWMTLRQADLQRLGLMSDEVQGIVGYARSISGVDVGMLFCEGEENVIKVSFRSRKPVDVSAVAKQVGGGGHARAAGCTYLGTIEQAQAQILPLVLKELECRRK